MTAHEDIVQGLTDRTRNLLRALDRHDRLEDAQQFIGWLDEQTTDGRLGESSQAVLLRALATAGDATNFRLLSALDPIEGTELPELMAGTGLERVAVSERINDLVQVGLAVREMISDQIRATALATGLLALVASIAEDSARQLTAELQGDRSPDETTTDD